MPRAVGLASVLAFILVAWELQMPIDKIETVAELAGMFVLLFL